MNKMLVGVGLSLALLSASTAVSLAQGNDTGTKKPLPPRGTTEQPSKRPLPSQQNKRPRYPDSGSQAAETRILDLGVTEAQLRQMNNLGMRLVMPKNIPSGFQLTDIVGRSDPRFGRSYLLVYQKGSTCFGIEGTSGGIGSVPPGDSSYPVKNAVLGRGMIEQRKSADGQQLIGQWMGRGPFYRFVGANYNFQQGELSRCQDVSAKDAVKISEALRFVDLAAGILTPVPIADANSPTSTVVRYPTNEELNQFRRQLQSGSLGATKLSASERSQRQAYQDTWAKLNPTGAKYAGAWTAGDRYYFIYPSKVKSRVCVVTLVDGKYEFSNGQSISRELRYRDNGLFWVDQSTALAARESGNGKLYPVFAAQSAPDPAELASFDFGFRNAECTTELPGGQNVGGKAR